MGEILGRNDVYWVRWHLGCWVIAWKSLLWLIQYATVDWLQRSELFYCSGPEFLIGEMRFWDGSHARSTVALKSLLKNACKETENANSKLRGSCTKQHYCTFIGKSKVSAHALSPSRYQYCEYHCSEAENSMYFDGNCTWSWPCLLLQFRSVNPISMFLPS